MLGASFADPSMVREARAGSVMKLSFAGMSCGMGTRGLAERNGKRTDGIVAADCVDSRDFGRASEMSVDADAIQRPHAFGPWRTRRDPMDLTRC